MKSNVHASHIRVSHALHAGRHLALGSCIGRPAKAGNAPISRTLRNKFRANGTTLHLTNLPAQSNFHAASLLGTVAETDPPVTSCY